MPSKTAVVLNPCQGRDAKQCDGKPLSIPACGLRRGGSQISSCNQENRHSSGRKSSLQGAQCLSGGVGSQNRRQQAQALNKIGAWELVPSVMRGNAPR